MTEAEYSVFQGTCTRSGLVIDTNMLIVYLVGLYNPDEIPKCKRTRDYKIDDFIFIYELVKNTKAKIIVTPHILAELSNHTFDKLFYEPGLSKYIKRVVDEVAKATEHPSSKDDLIIDIKSLARFGFADCSIIDAARTLRCAVLTNEGELSRSLEAEKVPVLDINHIRAWKALLPTA